MPSTSVASRSPEPKADPSAVSAEYREFAYIVSHDLQGPARTMVEFARLLMSDRAAAIFEDEDLYLKLIIESGEKLQGMISGLLAFSRLNGQIWQPQRLDMDVLTKSLISIHQVALKGSGGSFKTSGLPVVHADRMGMEQVLRALVDNALKFRREREALEIRLSAEPGHGFYTFCFADNGTGVAPDFCAEIFKPLRKLHTDTDFPGTGMGLTLARKIVEAQGGAMWAAPNAEGGLSVFFTLPQREEAS